MQRGQLCSAWRSCRCMKHPILRKLGILAADLLLAGGILLAFAYFHHVIPAQIVDGKVVARGLIDDDGSLDFTRGSKPCLSLYADGHGIGEDYLVTVRLDGTKPVEAGELTLGFDTSVLQYQTAEPGTVPLSECTGALRENRLTVSFRVQDPGADRTAGILCVIRFSMRSDPGSRVPVSWEPSQTLLYASGGAELSCQYAPTAVSSATGEEDLLFALDTKRSDTGNLYAVMVSADIRKPVSSGSMTLSYDASSLRYVGSRPVADGTVSVTAEPLGTEDGTGKFRLGIVPESEAAVTGSSEDLYVFLFYSETPVDDRQPVTLTVDPSDFVSPSPVSCGVIHSAVSRLCGDFRDLYPEEFSRNGIAVDTENEFQSENIHAKWYSVHDDETYLGKVDYYVIDFYLRTPELLRTYIGMKGDGTLTQTTTHEMAKNNQALAAINGDNFRFRLRNDARSIVVRNGILYRNTGAVRDLLVYYESGEMEILHPEDAAGFDPNAKGILDIWGFGPSLLNPDGTPIGLREFDMMYPVPPHPRSAIGYYAPGHYCFICVDGRGDSEGMALSDLSKLCGLLGLTSAYNLDGGDSSSVVWDGNVINNVSGKSEEGREISDILYIPKE